MATSPSGHPQPATADPNGSDESRASERRGRLRPTYLKRLSEYNLFAEPLRELTPKSDTIAYQITTPLFSDYAAKHRVVRLPAGTSATYHPRDVFDFPIGTVIAKTFYYPADMRDPDSPRDLVETRILIHEQTGWVGLPYVWNDDQTDASLSLTGASVDVEWVHDDGQHRSNTHLVPNFNDCKRCHQNEKMEPIGPRAGFLNRDFDDIGDGRNQIDYWIEKKILVGAPDRSRIPRFAVWNDRSTGTIDDRARAWLDINCTLPQRYWSSSQLWIAPACRGNRSVSPGSL
ncbi:MAG: hypothetical protein R3C05_27115 [Pirellulaceae bacterium]